MKSAAHYLSARRAGGFQSQDPEAAAAEQASEDGTALHLEDERDELAIESAERTLAHLRHRLHELADHIDRIDEHIRALVGRVRSRAAQHAEGHRVVSRLLEKRQRRQQVHVSAPGADIHVDAADAIEEVRP